MRYFLDCEFDGHNGPLLSMALVKETGPSLHVRTDARATDPWVIANVEPLMDRHDADSYGLCVPLNGVGTWLRNFMADDDAPVIVADAPGDIARFCAAIGTGEDGAWTPTEYPRLTFEYHNVEPYPTTLPGAVQHNAWWDAMALREKLALSSGAPPISPSEASAATSVADEPNTSSLLARVAELEGALREEREACANLAESHTLGEEIIRTGMSAEVNHVKLYAVVSRTIAKAIRARSALIGEE